jgi:hypothetical protein
MRRELNIVKDPYPECENCKCIEDCPHPTVELNMVVCIPMPPDVCPKPMDILRTKRKKKANGVPRDI